MMVLRLYVEIQLPGVRYSQPLKALPKRRFGAEHQTGFQPCPSQRLLLLQQLSEAKALQ